MNWYVVHTYASHEFKIKEAIEKGTQGTKLEKNLGQILIPTQKTFHIRDGKKVEREKKLFNSYIIIEADLTPEFISFVVGLPGVTHFLGHGKKPIALSEAEINRLLGISDRDKSETEDFDFLPGDMVKITSGPFSDFDGVIDKVSEDKQKLTVKVTVFGRVTPVEVKSDQIEIL
ncbi:MAG: transcription termination/antitermination protein NusG [Candidatus Cloacimonetes bacterium]|nr:transcription termination/antitermination protein NusG [Candidatus Cloacimonadota bacterium]MCF7814951.1 transcription termination/antitermination protein NusG [Candidatus Cloacimonadota bacterium]MCF7869237.1 transcription termination/antitermination protein NusG [Candidatus Cloacimonadota bacterium]MCF7884654.1 transcription termination/antitermination protein NusG [Candidatus Cloacimonadota bacterium]